VKEECLARLILLGEGSLRVRYVITKPTIIGREIPGQRQSIAIRFTDTGKPGQGTMSKAAGWSAEIL
jgi:hypothetical protein